ncbi:MAG: peptidyl-prolyl cis-trans isomerase [Erysipelotrichaceae bacterium]|nr:peptidyl-prolyl cis-trans isomerase [Erysipelotrichaceae bacterium]
MKKLIGILCVAMLMMVSGCKDATTTVSNGSEMIMRVGDKTITKENVNKLLKLYTGYNTVLQNAIQKILDAEITITEEIEAKARESLAKSKENLGEKFASMLTSNGYVDEEDYYKNVSLNGVLRQELVKKYLIDENKIETYHPFKAQMLIAKDEESAKAALAEIQNGADFETVTRQYGDTSKSDGTVQIYHSSSGLPAIVTEKVTNTAQAQLIEEVITDSANSVYYVIRITDYDYKNFVQEAADSIIQNATLNDEAIAFYLKKHQFKVYDIDIYNGIKKTNPNYLVQDQ